MILKRCIRKLKSALSMYLQAQKILSKGVKMIPGIDPQKLAQVQQTSRYIKGHIVINYTEGSVTIKMSSDNPQAKQMISTLLDQFAEGLAAQLQTFFAIEGEIEEIGKK